MNNEITEGAMLLRKVCRDATYMVFLYDCDNADGKCTARTHDAKDGGDEPISVGIEEARWILDEYCFERKHRYKGEFGTAQVYVANRGAQKIKAKTKAPAWLDVDRFD